MKGVPLDELPVVGALDRDVTADGVVFRRSPDWARPQITDPAQTLMVTMPAGVRLAALTGSRALELDLMLTGVQLAGMPAYAVAVDLVVDGELRRSQTVDDRTTILVRRDGSIEFLPGGPVTVRFDDLPGDDSVPVEVWLPHGAVTELRAVRVDDGTSLRPAPQPARRWVHHGSSISHCLEAPSPTATWPALVARQAGVDLLNLAVAGQCQLDQHVARTIRDAPADAISVKAGINVVNGDTMRERTFGPALHGFLDTIREGHPTAPLLVVTPIICPEAEDHPGPTLLGEDGRFHVAPRPRELSTGALTLRRTREIAGQVVAARRAAGDSALHLLDGLSLFGPDDADDLPDGLHPNPDGYRRMAERFHRQVFGPGGPFAT